MNAEETKAAAAVMIASETKNIQQRYRHGKSDEGWVDCPEPDWDWDMFEFRISPEPIEVEVWFRPRVGCVSRSHQPHDDDKMIDQGWTLRRATIHPEQP